MKISGDSGIVLVNKPEGLSSQQVVSRVKRIFSTKKAGHTGSLDPMATGMLPVCIGRATKLCEYLLDSDKSYRAEVFLGAQTDSGDREGKIVATAPVPALTQENIDAVLHTFLGKQSQVPPMFSALKHQGKCLYTLARSGIEIERAARPIEIYSIQCLTFSKTNLTIELRCSKGTYVRVLGEDIAKQLGTLGHLIALYRISCAGFRESEMQSLERLKETQKVIPIEKVLSYPHADISSGDLTQLMQGKSVHLDSALSGRFQLLKEHRLVAVADLLQGTVQARKII